MTLTLAARESHNFGFLALHEPQLYAEAAQAEACFVRIESNDLTVVGLRRFVEALVGKALARFGQVMAYPKETLHERMDRLERTGQLAPAIIADFGEARRIGNKGSHVGSGNCTMHDAVAMMRLVRRLGIWWLGQLGVDDVKPPLFRVPQTGERALDAKNAAEAARAEKVERGREQERVTEVKRARVVVHDRMQAAYEALDDEGRKELTSALEALRASALEVARGSAIEGVADEKLRAVPAGERVSVVVAAPAQADVVFALWACAPAEVAGWAHGKRVEVHPAIGTVQLYDVDDVEARAGGDRGGAKLFDAFGDDELVRVGLPAPLVPAVRVVENEAAFRVLAPLLPAEAAEALELLAASGSVGAVLAVLRLAPSEAVDTNDFEVAVEHPASKRTFRLLEKDDDLEAALSGSIEAWRLFLHPDQRALVRMQAKGPVQVLGGAGTGKTVALLHRAAFLLQEVLVDGQILVTTYTRNLAVDLDRALGRLVGDAARKRATVMNLHRLARQIAASADGGKYAGFEIVQPDVAERLWDAAMAYEALGLERSFYLDELAEVVHARGVVDEAGYLGVTRGGRGVSLGRKQRSAVWKVFAAYERLKAERKLVEWADLVRHARERIESGAWKSPYRSVLADEVQDFSPDDLRLLRALVPRGSNDLFVVGDAHQRIYGTKTSMRQCGIEVQGRSRRLRVNYRTTEEIRGVAVKVLEGHVFDDIDGGVDTLAGYRSLRSGLEPRTIITRDGEAEVDAIAAVLRDWLDRYPAEALCVTARTRPQVKKMIERLRARGVAVVAIEGDQEPGAGVRVATMHRLKGLEFSCVLVSGVEAGNVPLTAHGGEGGDGSDTREQAERALFYVATTRARDELVLTCGGPPSPWLS